MFEKGLFLRPFPLSLGLLLGVLFLLEPALFDPSLPLDLGLAMLAYLTHDWTNALVGFSIAFFLFYWGFFALWSTQTARPFHGASPS